MKKKREMAALILMLILISIIVGACSAGKNVGEPVDLEVVEVNGKPVSEDHEDIGIKATEDVIADLIHTDLTLKEDGVYVYKVTVSGDTVVQVGREYKVEKLVGEELWEEVDLGIAFTQEIIEINSDNPFSQEINVSELGLGEFRISKIIMDLSGKQIKNIGVHNLILV